MFRFGHRIPVHKHILYAANVYFEALFTTELKERNQPEITLTGVDGDVLQQLVEYCYTGVITIDSGNVEKMTYAATMFQFTWVQGICAEFYTSILNTSNCLSILGVADLHNLVELEAKARSFVLEHFLDVIKSEEFLQLSEADLTGLLKNDENNVAQEDDVLSAAMTWISHDVVNRKESLAALLDSIRFKYIRESVSVSTRCYSKFSLCCLQSIPNFSSC